MSQTSGNRRQKSLRIARRAEISAANRFSGKVTAGSGNQWYQKGDVRLDNVIIEVKSTSKDTYRLTSAVVEKVKDAAKRSGVLYWIIVVSFSGEYGQEKTVNLVCGDFVKHHSAVENPRPLSYCGGSLTVSSEMPRQWHVLNAEEICVMPEEEVLSLLQVSSAETFSDLGKLLSALIHRDRTKQVRRTGVISGSDLGRCVRRAWYRLNRSPEEASVQQGEGTSVVFWMGESLHVALQKELRKLFPHILIEIAANMSLQSGHSFSGTADGYLSLPPKTMSLYAAPPGSLTKEEEALRRAFSIPLHHGVKYLIEIKTCSVTPLMPSEDHLMQAGAYAICLGATHLLFLYVNKGSGVITTYTREFNDRLRENVTNELRRLTEKANDETPPERERGRDCDTCRYRGLCGP